VIWSEAAQAVMESIVEGIARVDKCSGEGRNRMSDDLQRIQASGRVRAVRAVRAGGFSSFFSSFFEFRFWIFRATLSLPNNTLPRRSEDDALTMS
jgi:hypothetical protein